jgi:hypothetical protein
MAKKPRQQEQKDTPLTYTLKDAIDPTLLSKLTLECSTRPKKITPKNPQ